MNELNDREQILVALGAAIASNCVPCIEYHVPAAKRAGLGDVEIKEAVRIADKVRRVPARAVLETALARIDTSLDAPEDKAVSGCGCGGSNQAAESGGVS